MSDQKANVLSYIERLRKPAGVPPFIQREAADILQWHVDALEAKDKDREFWDARWAEKTKRLEARVAELEAEVGALRRFGNKDCTAMADDWLSACAEFEDELRVRGERDDN